MSSAGVSERDAIAGVSAVRGHRQLIGLPANLIADGDRRVLSRVLQTVCTCTDTMLLTSNTDFRLLYVHNVSKISFRTTRLGFHFLAILVFSRVT